VPAGRKSFLDTVWARLIAGLVAATFAALLVWINRDALMETAGGGLQDTCLAQRMADIDKLVADGTISGGQAKEFQIRARQLCAQSAPQ